MINPEDDITSIQESLLGKRQVCEEVLEEPSVAIVTQRPRLELAVPSETIWFQLETWASP